VLNAHDLSEVALKRIHVGPEGSHPVRVERVEEKLALARTHVRRRKEDARHVDLRLK
jgi:hypothetical protein